MNSIQVNRPFDGTLIKEVVLQNEENVERALQVADGLFQDRSEWLPAYERIAILEKTVEIMNGQIEELTPFGRRRRRQTICRFQG